MEGHQVPRASSAECLAQSILHVAATHSLCMLNNWYTYEARAPLYLHKLRIELPVYQWVADRWRLSYLIAVVRWHRRDVAIVRFSKTPSFNDGNTICSVLCQACGKSETCRPATHYHVVKCSIEEWNAEMGTDEAAADNRLDEISSLDSMR
jgi:hypothetical protein